MENEKIRTLNTRVFKYLTCNRIVFINANKSFEESLLVGVTNEKGYIEFELTNLSSDESKKLENPASGEYAFPLKKGEKYRLTIKAKACYGRYKIQIKTIK